MPRSTEYDVFHPFGTVIFSHLHEKAQRQSIDSGQNLECLSEICHFCPIWAEFMIENSLLLAGFQKLYQIQKKYKATNTFWMYIRVKCKPERFEGNDFVAKLTHLKWSCWGISTQTKHASCLELRAEVEPHVPIGQIFSRFWNFLSADTQVLFSDCLVFALRPANWRKFDLPLTFSLVHCG